MNAPLQANYDSQEKFVYKILVYIWLDYMLIHYLVTLRWMKTSRIVFDSLYNNNENTPNICQALFLNFLIIVKSFFVFYNKLSK